MSRALTISVLLFLAAGSVGGCQAPPKRGHFELPPESIARRQVQTRRFETSDETKILQACAHLLQDLGFTIDESEAEAGLIVASKMRTAKETGEVVVSIILAGLGGGDGSYKERQKLRVSIVTRPHGEMRGNILVRATFQRIVWDNHGRVVVLEGIDEPEYYLEFFAKLSKAVFLEANEI
jgi:uncharacterized lipoprotein